MEEKDKKRTLLKIVSNDTQGTTELSFHTETANDIGEIVYALSKVLEECPSIMSMLAVLTSTKYIGNTDKCVNKDGNEETDEENEFSNIDFNKLFFNKNNED